MSPAQVVYAETLSNPTLRMVDLPRLVGVAHARVRNAAVPLVQRGQHASCHMSKENWSATSTWQHISVQGMTCVVDNTFASLTVSPALWGVDVVVQSLTKYTSGSGDIVAGRGAAV
jgi:cystathionine beta-lyase/cystathionine gamma-synthase